MVKRDTYLRLVWSLLSTKLEYKENTFIMFTELDDLLENNFFSVPRIKILKGFEKSVYKDNSNLEEGSLNCRCCEYEGQLEN